MDLYPLNPPPTIKDKKRENEWINYWLEKSGVDVIQGDAQFVGPKTVEVSGQQVYVSWFIKPFLYKKGTHTKKRGITINL